MYSDAPKHLPPFSFLFDELADRLAHPRAASLARHLDVALRTVQRWIKTDSAPRAVLLAMYWDTRYGQQAIDARMYNDLQMQVGLARCHRDTARARVRELENLLAVGNFGSANSPLIGATSPVTLPDSVFGRPLRPWQPEPLAPPAQHDDGDDTRPTPARAPEPAPQRVKRAGAVVR